MTTSVTLMRQCRRRRLLVLDRRRRSRGRGRAGCRRSAAGTRSPRRSATSRRASRRPPPGVTENRALIESTSVRRSPERTSTSATRSSRRGVWPVRATRQRGAVADAVQERRARRRRRRTWRRARPPGRRRSRRRPWTTSTSSSMVRDAYGRLAPASPGTSPPRPERHEVQWRRMLSGWATLDALRAHTLGSGAISTR